jgi:hypothetical protein
VLSTANGLITANEVVTFEVSELGSKPEVATILPSTPRVLSAGVFCVDGGCDFVWNGSRGERPYILLLADKKGVRKRVWPEVVPYLRSRGTALSAVTPLSVPALPAEEETKKELMEDEAHDVLPGGDASIKAERDPSTHGDPAPGGGLVKHEEDDGEEEEEPIAPPRGPREPPEVARLRRDTLREEAKSVAHMATHNFKNPILSYFQPGEDAKETMPAEQASHRTSAC